MLGINWGLLARGGESDGAERRDVRVWAPARAVLAGGATVFAVLVAASPAGAIGPVSVGAQPQLVAGGTPLGPDHPLLGFSGSSANPLPIVFDPDPTVCASAEHCQLWFLQVATRLPFMVSVHTVESSFNPNEGYNLYVYDPSGQVVGSSGGVGSDGQAVSVLAPVVGRYTIAVTLTYGYDDPVAYQGEARLLVPPTWHSATPSACTLPSGAKARCLLPQLEVLPPSDVRVTGLPPVASTPLGFPFPVSLAVPTSCYLDEMLGLDALTVLPPSPPQHPTVRCLRFTTDVRDVGGGPLTVRWNFVSDGQTPQSGYLPGECHAEQVVALAGGGSVVRPAGSCQFHLAHGHFHYSGLVVFGLYSVGADGVSPDHLVVAAAKKSFCLAADDYFGFGTPGPANGPRMYFGQPGCNVPATVTAGVYGVMGISPGWGDVYTWDTPGQYVDVTSVPDGVYDIVDVPNPDHLLLTAGGDRCGITQVRLSQTTVQVLRSWETTACPTSTPSALPTTDRLRSTSSPSAAGDVAATGVVAALPDTTAGGTVTATGVAAGGVAGLAGLALGGRRRRHRVHGIGHRHRV